MFYVSSQKSNLYENNLIHSSKIKINIKKNSLYIYNRKTKDTKYSEYKRVKKST